MTAADYCKAWEAGAKAMLAKMAGHEYEWSSALSTYKLMKRRSRDYAADREGQKDQTEHA